MPPREFHLPPVEATPEQIASGLFKTAQKPKERTEKQQANGENRNPPKRS